MPSRGAAKRPRLFAALAILAVLLLMLWALRLRIAGALVDRRLAAAHVPASYRLTKIGPFLERMEDVRIGDPAAPDLVARQIDVTIGYGLTGPAVRGVDVDGVRLSARIDDQGLHLGALDRLLPKTGGKVELPDLTVQLHDVRLALATPNGAIRVALAGRGNPARAFGGTAQVEADRLRLASCSLSRVSADLKIATDLGAPRVRGPVRIMGMGCPGLALGRGELRIAATSSKAFDRVTGRATPAGFAGRAGPARFAGVGGAIDAAGTLGHLKGKGALTFAHLALPDQAEAIADVAIPAGLPITPTARRAARGTARLLRDASARIEFEGAIEGLRASVRVHRMMLAGPDGARLSATGGQGLSWAPSGWQVDTDVASGGGDLPPLRLRIRQAGEGQPLSGNGRLDPYAAGGAKIAAPRLSIESSWSGARFDALIAIDGPLGGGFVRGLTVPIDGRISADAGIAINPGCRSISFRKLQQNSFVFDPASIRVCGQPLFARTSRGAMRIDAAVSPVRLTGRSGTSPIFLAANGVKLTERGFSVAGLQTAIGAPNHLTRLEAVALDGRFGNATGGTFSGATGAIANVPLDLKGAAGEWTLRGGALGIKGKLQLGDQAAEPRFFPLDADAVTLGLAGGRVTAAGILRQPSRGIEIARVALAHDLATGTGHADLAVPGIAFVPKGLQPEALTPLTLGVVANVAGTVSGRGRIDWSPAAVTSTGMFSTDRIDLAAAFGPVSGIAGRIVFTDLLGLVTAPAQEARIAELNPGVIVADGIVHYQLIGANRVRIEDATFPFAAGKLRLDPATLDFSKARERRLTFRVEKADAAAFIQQLDFPNLSATGTFDGTLPMIFDDNGGRIEQGYIAAEGGGTLAYVGELTSAQLGTMGKLAFDALKAIRYSALDISLDGRLDGEMVSKVRFTGIREATPEQSLVTRLIRNLPFRFNIAIRAPFRGLVGSARAYMDPSLLLNHTVIAPPVATNPPDPPIQPAESGDVR
ncbi:YdbH domain-containing protein [Sphingomonas sp. BIUV-7]|uniref:YdbH domain-containing protein n=1 Tax=Sphingomonas natans TaxID=3063330 RepID=A0ABT8YBS8_9SPHN|nr:YdbH domain-containing protein [Sphingomonas sp. BIUV-7]MDO6415777.1 YdbH domain-containing protein [Sphingomonas sp. BIUV-7]